MRSFSIGTKTFLLAFAVGLIGLCAVIFALVRQRIDITEVRFRSELQSFADIAATNVGPHLSAGQKEQAAAVLQNLQASTGITGSILYDQSAAPFAKVGEIDSDPSFLRENTKLRMFQRGEYLYVARPVRWAGRQCGTLIVAGDAQRACRPDFSEMLKSVAGIAAVGLLLSFCLAAMMRKLVARPVENLVSAAVNAEKSGELAQGFEIDHEHEIGLLANSFNRILKRIETQDKQLHETKTTLGTKVRALADSETRLKSVIESLAEALILVNRQGVIVQANSRALPVLGWEHGELVGRTAVETLFVPADQPRAQQLFEQALSGSLCSAELDVTPPLGTLRPVEVHWNRLIGDNGEVAGVLAAFLNIAERKRAAEALAEANARLVDTSRKAGMAEIATNVLHNVGNAFNSVNVGLTVIGERLRESRLNKLRSAVELLQKQGENLAHWLTSDERGKHFVSYLDSLTSKLASNEATMLGEITRLDTHIEHIKHIITTQQSYAKAKALIEHVPLARLIEHCLELESSITKSGILISLDVPRGLVVAADRHKTIQILCNLLRNARDAIRDASPEVGIITIEATKLEARDRAIIQITDNGCGIAPEHITRIFGHGFTTKERGHGFGLHASALAAMEMGGTLNANSNGNGAGSTFTLELPTPM